MKEIENRDYLINRDVKERDMVLICPIHKLLCSGCDYGTLIPRIWLSNKLIKELEEYGRNKTNLSSH